MSGIRTNAAAELLGVSPNTLRSWERRFGYPKPRRTSGGHRQYDLTELEALRRALLETHNISSAIEVARQRGEGPTSAARLVEAFDRFDDALADRVMEESLAVRSVERSVEDLMLPALDSVRDSLAGQTRQTQAQRISEDLHAQLAAELGDWHSWTWRRSRSERAADEVSLARARSRAPSQLAQLPTPRAVR